MSLQLLCINKKCSASYGVGSGGVMNKVWSLALLTYNSKEIRIDLLYVKEINN